PEPRRDLDDLAAADPDIEKTAQPASGIDDFAVLDQQIVFHRAPPFRDDRACRDDLAGPASPGAKPGRQLQRGGAATPPRNSWTTTPSRRGGGASHIGCARLVATSFSPACQRRCTASAEKSATLSANSSAFPSCTR